jgi:thioredoxin 1
MKLPMIYQLMKTPSQTTPVPVGDVSFVREVLRSKLTVLTFFFTEWSWSCRSLNPLLADVAADYPGLIKVVKVNVDQNPGLETWYSIHAVPTLLCFNDGEETTRMVGRPSVKALLSKLTRSTYAVDAHAAARE